jgi:flagellar hook-associated protein 3 FlgL
LNNGAGVRTVTGADFQITNSAGASFQVDLSSAQTTVQDVINAINSAASAAGVSGVTAGFATTGNGITLTDTAGGSGTITVTPLNFSNAAADLGLTTDAVGNTITGTDVNGVSDPGLFSDLTALATALQSNDQAGITAAGAALQNDLTTITNTHGAVGANLQQITNQQSQMSGENVATQTLLSTLQDTDFTTAVTQFQQLQNALEASLETAAHSLNLNLMDFLS